MMFMADQLTDIKILLEQHIERGEERWGEVESSINWLSDIVGGEKTDELDEHGHAIRAGGLQKLILQSNNGGLILKKVPVPWKAVASIAASVSIVLGALLNAV